MTGPSIDVIASPETWIESDAVQQLRATAGLPGMRRAVGMPDLHPGKGAPIGAVFACAGWIYPHLIGTDIGCGMALFRTDLPRKALKLDRFEKRLADLDGPWSGDAAAWLAEHGVTDPAAPPVERDVADPAAPHAVAGPSPYADALGTIGLGNHFAELQLVDEIVDPPAAEQVGLDATHLVLLVHSGSRGLGEAVLRSHTDRYAAAGLADGTAEQAAYLTRHDHAVAWAHANRALIARRVLHALGADGQVLLDVAHNTVERGTLDDGHTVWLHRKGATPADHGPVVIAGTRGTFSYLVQPSGDGAATLCTLAHGAGRKWKRSEARGRLEGRFRAQDLVRTSLGGRVICEDRSLLYEEAPQAYKDVEQVVADLVAVGAARVVARLRPVLTYKTRRRR
jgi:release factor H-coupled RctB family protein